MQAEEREQTRSTGDDCDEGRGYEIVLTFLSTIEQSAVLLEAEVEVNEICASEQLHDHSGTDDRRDSKLHEGTAVRRQNDMRPIQWVGRVGRHDGLERYL